MEGLITTRSLKECIAKELGLELKAEQIYAFVKKEMGLVWKRIRPQARYVNSETNVKLRQLFARKMLELMAERKVVINFDETVIRGTTRRCYSWADKKTHPMHFYSQEVTDLALLVALSSEGDILFQFLSGPNNYVSVQSFLAALAAHFDLHKSEWSLLLDNCPSHKTQDTLKLLESLRIPTVFSAPASYIAIPVGQLFGQLKSLDLKSKPDPNPDDFEDETIKKFTNKQKVMLQPISSA